MMIKLADRYIGRAAVQGTLGVWLAMTTLFIIFSLLGELRDTRADYSTADALWFTALTIPRLAYQVFPVSALLGALVGVGGLAAANELVAFRTSGISRLRLALAALAGTLLLTGPVMMMGEWVAPSAEHQARAFRLSEVVGTAIIGGARGMWIRDGNDIINIQRPVLNADRGEQSIDFKDVVIYRFSRTDGLQGITRAKNATHDGERWSLEDISRVEFNGESAISRQAPAESWATEIKPGLLDSAVSRPKLLSIRSLRDYLGYLGENELDDRVYRAAFWEKVLFPFTVIALVLAGMPFVFSNTRSQSLGLRMFIGMTVGGLFMIVSRAFQKVTSVYDLPPLMTMSIPILLLAIGAVVVLRRSV
ncbi:MAG: LPS export ABC transporter permease LptG [Gammaproteobacteria bacterium]|nr:LPS export ABC transporter permease LptG [Gammaproteobacteria bacterium]MBT8050245.1 LPS export ABC transporter permease LptG [Gammaproteobacteria bacterium]NNJ79254.1 LPS export ABC transporter permease LptG [Xanthomonadales bacterium]